MQTQSIGNLVNLLRSCIDQRSYLTGKLIHARIVRHGLLSSTFLCNRLIDLYIACNKKGYARSVFDDTPRKDIYSWNTMLAAYCKAGELECARQLFGRMPERDSISWNNMISSFVKNGFEDKAWDAYLEMISDGLMPTRFTLASIFSACGALLDVERGRNCHGVAVKIGLEKNIYVGNALLFVYAKCGCIEDAIQAFMELPDPNEVSFTTVMCGLAQTDRVQEAVHMFRLMCNCGKHIDPFVLSGVLGFCSHVEYNECFLDNCSGSNLYIVLGHQIHSLTVKLGFEKDTHLNNAIIHMYAENGDMESAEMIFGNLSEINIVAWNMMIAGYANKCQVDKAISYLWRMQGCGFLPDEITHVNMLMAFVKSGNIEFGRQMFDQMSFPKVSSWNAMLSGYFQSGNHIEVMKLFRKMQSQCVRPDGTTFAIILSSCARMGLLDFGRQVHAASLRATVNADIYIASGLITMYSNCANVEWARCIFYKMPELDIICWNSMIAGLMLNCLCMEAIAFFNQMRCLEILPTEFSYATILSCCSKLSSSFHGTQIHAQMAKDGYVEDQYVGSVLIGMYCKCGDVDGARRFFDMMSFRNTVAWNEMIHGYARNGFGHEAVCLYKNMICSGRKPDGITFVAVLTACSHAGLVDAGIAIFNSMKQEHGVGPLLDHYTCIIDCLGRAGCFNEVEVLIDKMPYRDEPIVWEVLLSSCRTHANVRLAKRAAEELLWLDPQNSTPYVLLANIYASLGRWDEARAVRDQMNGKQIVKGPGCSWIDNKHEILTFIGYNPEVMEERIGGFQLEVNALKQNINLNFV